MLGLFERIGIVPGTEFDPARLHPATVDGMRRGIGQALTSLLGEMPFCVPNVNGWLIPDPARSGNFGTDYHLRLVTAEIGLLANDAPEALYIGCFSDDSGEPLVGGRRYTVHFDADRLPPVDEFWSFTMYTHPPGSLTESTTNRYHLGTLTPGFMFNADGSVDIHIQHESPSPDEESNWLPTTPAGELFRIIFRMYNPGPHILNGTWAPPPIRRVDSSRSTTRRQSPRSPTGPHRGSNDSDSHGT